MRERDDCDMLEVVHTGLGVAGENDNFWRSDCGSIARPHRLVGPALLADSQITKARTLGMLWDVVGP